jgi:hypothetical protein
MNFGSEYITRSAVETVSAFLSANPVPLSTTIANIAERDGLNSDQINRLIEAVNQVAYLKMQGTAEDKTFEFPLANKDEVMSILTKVPEQGQLSMDKQASQKMSKNPLSAFSKHTSSPTDNSMEKTASEADTKLDDRQALSVAFSAMQRAENELTKLAGEEMDLISSLSNQLAICRRDPECLEKIAYLTDSDDETMSRASTILHGHIKKASEYGYFYESDLTDAKKLLGLIKHAYELRTKKASLSDNVNKIKSNLNSAVIATKNTLNRAKSNMPTKGMVAITAPLYEPKTPVWSSLQKMPE